MIFQVQFTPGVIQGGATVTSGNNTNEITVDYDNTATSGSWTVTASLSCGTVTAPVNYAVTVNEIPQIDPLL